MSNLIETHGMNNFEVEIAV